jgi:hypothetical protein
VVRLLKYSLGSAALLVTTIGGLGGLNLYTYQRLTSETTVADLVFERKAPRTFEVSLQAPGRPVERFLLRGDEWQLDVRMIKWRDWLTFLGEDPLYRLDRISGRYTSTADTVNAMPTAHALADEGAFDVWAFAREAGDWLPGIDAAYGSSVFLPMRDGASYRVTISRTGLLARAAQDGSDQ